MRITADREDRWFVRGNGSKTERRLDGLSFSEGDAASFGDFSISPEANWLAVSVAEEGHPILLFRQLPAVLIGAEDTVELPQVAIYPGGLSIEGWKDDSHLVISSDQDLMRRDEEVLTEDFRRYLVHLPDGAIGRADPPR